MVEGKKSFKMTPHRYAAAKGSAANPARVCGIGSLVICASRIFSPAQIKHNRDMPIAPIFSQPDVEQNLW